MKNYFQETAKAFADTFITSTRNDGTTFARLTDHCAEWMRDAVYAAHAGVLPSDIIYRLCADAADAISECESEEDALDGAADTFADSAVDIYTTDRLAWLAAHSAHADLVDRGVEELGGHRESIIEDIARGQYLQAREVYETLVSAIVAEAETEEACDWREETERRAD